MKRNEYNRLLSEFELGKVEQGMAFKTAKAQRKALISAIAALPRRNKTSAYISITPLRTVASWIMTSANYSVWSETRWHRHNGC